LSYDYKQEASQLDTLKGYPVIILNLKQGLLLWLMHMTL
jgi:hypothetical protein